MRQGAGGGALPIFCNHFLFCNHFEVFQIKLIINNAPLTQIYPDTIETIFNTQSFIIWQTINIFFCS